jgi:hypothetical protein
MADYDFDIMIEVGSYIEDDDIYPPALGEISDESMMWHLPCMIVLTMLSLVMLLLILLR